MRYQGRRVFFDFNSDLRGKRGAGLLFGFNPSTPTQQGDYISYDFSVTAYFSWPWFVKQMYVHIDDPYNSARWTGRHLRIIRLSFPWGLSVKFPNGQTFSVMNT
jgi:hypothetical protein